MLDRDFYFIIKEGTMKILKSGISKPIICSRCKKRVGFVRLKLNFNLRIIALGLVIALIFEFIAEILVRITLGF